MYCPNMNLGQYIRKTDGRPRLHVRRTFLLHKERPHPFLVPVPPQWAPGDRPRHPAGATRLQSDCCCYQWSTATTTRRVRPNDANIFRALTTACLVPMSVRTRWPQQQATDLAFCLFLSFLPSSFLLSSFLFFLFIYFHFFGQDSTLITFARYGLLDTLRLINLNCIYKHPVRTAQ